jgi:xanthine dehydrogenase small subunit
MIHRIQFVLDNRMVEIDFSPSGQLKPTTTVLNYLRSVPGHKGVKEGCGEGDCGACTVVVAEPGDDGRLKYQAIDSCLVFLPMIHGKQVITVENLALENGREKILHPVQQMMVEHNGTQCGYCTPGIVMSLFSLYKNHKNPADKVILDSLSGNLCRCTGYQPILDCAREVCNSSDPDQFTLNEASIISLLKQIRKNDQTLELWSSGQVYYKPFTLAEALRIRKEHPYTLVAAGSTDIALRQTKKKEILTAILDLSEIEDFNHIHETSDHWLLGSGINLEQVRSWSESRIPALHSMLDVFGSLQIRNLATLGGNIGSASPIGDTIPLLMALQAKVKLKSHGGERVVGIENFITGYRRTDLHPEELIAEIIIPKLSAEAVVWSHKISKRKNLDISTVSAGFRLKVEGSMISEIMLAFGGMAETPKRAHETEKFLTGKAWDRSNIETAMNILAGDFKPITDARASAEYRTVSAGNLLLKFFIECS